MWHTEFEILICLLEPPNAKRRVEGTLHLHLALVADISYYPDLEQ